MQNVSPRPTCELSYGTLKGSEPLEGLGTLKEPLKGVEFRGYKGLGFRGLGFRVKGTLKRCYKVSSKGIKNYRVL